MFQKNVIQRKKKIVVGLSYDYSDDEVEQFLLAKMFKDVVYSYAEIKKEMATYKTNKIEVLDNVISKTSKKIEN